MRNKYSLQYITLVILLSISSILGEFALLHILKDDPLALLVSSGIVVILSLLLLMTSYHYEAVFIYLLLTVILSTILVGYRFLEIHYFYFSMEEYDIWLIMINFILPTTLCFFTKLFNPSDTFTGYPIFVRNSTLLFSSYYVVFLIFIEYVSQANTYLTSTLNNWIPFYTTAGYIEDYIYDDLALRALLLHILIPILIFVPLGFLLRYYLRNKNRRLFYFVLFLIPILIEGLQQLFRNTYVNIDDIINAIFGSFIGQLIFLCVNRIFHWSTGNDFPGVKNSTSTYHRLY